MAKLSSVQKNLFRFKLIKKYKAKRESLKLEIYATLVLRKKEQIKKLDQV